MMDDQIHWFSIVNSLMIVLFLSGMVAMIMMRTLHRDISNYNQLETAEEAGEETGALEEIRIFVETARGEAPGEVVLCRIEIVGDDLELALYTEAGRFLDSLTLAAASLPAPAAEMPRLIEAFVPVVRDAPGR